MERTDKLLRAAVSGLVPPLATHGFRATGSEALRGETVECTNGYVLITVIADWLEGELDVTVRTLNEPAKPLAEVIDIAHKALHLTRLGRGASVRTIQAQLRKIAEELVTQRPDIVRAR